MSFALPVNRIRESEHWLALYHPPPFFNLVRRFDLARSGYRLIVNGGQAQDIPQLHFHLVSDRAHGEGVLI
jgi:hypothetical protein